MKCFVLIFSLLFLSNLPFPFSVFAEELERGRLPDGRAYRTDEDGTQLVDYIAELEVENESLRRQVIGLEDENKAKQASIEGLRRSGGVEPKVVEKDLGANLKPASVIECKPKIVEVEKVVEKVIEKVIEKPVACPPVAKVPEKKIVEIESPDRQVMVKEITSLREEIAQTNKKLKEKDDELEQRQIDIAILNNKLEASESMAKEKVKLASIPLPVGETAQQRSNLGSFRPAFNDSRYRAVDMLRKTMLQDLRRFEDLVRYRDNLYARVDKTKFPEREHVSIPELRSRLQASEQVHELSRVRTQISESRGKIQHEIALYKRDLKIR